MVFLLCGADEGTINAAKAMGTITDAVTHCRFEATAPDSDEVVLAAILEVLAASKTI